MFKDFFLKKLILNINGKEIAKSKKDILPHL